MLIAMEVTQALEDAGAHTTMTTTARHANVDLTYWYRIVPMRSYVKGWKISPSHYLNQDLANIWLDK